VVSLSIRRLRVGVEGFVSESLRKARREDSSVSLRLCRVRKVTGIEVSFARTA
jgi:hypothetical protein